MVDVAQPITTQPRYFESIKRWEAFWALEDLGRPLWLIPTAPAQTAALVGLARLPELVQDKNVQLKAELALLNWRESFGIEDDFVPHLQPMGGVSVFASAFGCKIQYFEHTLPWAHPVVRASDAAAQVYDLRASVTDGQLGEMLDFTNYFVAETGGRYPIALTDCQGPLDTAYLVWDSSAFMTAMYTNPKEVHHVMRLVTDLIIAYVKEQRSLSPEFIPCHFPPIYLPDGKGIAISDDGLAVIGPNLYREFCLPYVNELSEEFGGILIHSCGNFVHQLGNLEKVHNLRGLNFGASETPFEAVWQRFNGKTAIIPHLGLNNPLQFGGNREYMEHIGRIKTHNRGLCLLVTPGALEISLTDPDSIPRFLKRAEETIQSFCY